jgi:hypothetical protein
MKGKSLWVSVRIKVVKRFYIGTKWKMKQLKKVIKMKRFHLIKKYFENGTRDRVENETKN